MIVYLINAETGEVISDYKNVIGWGHNFVEYDNGGRCKIYCRNNEYFTEVIDGEDNSI